MTTESSLRGTASWQAEYLRTHVKEQSGYLEAAAALPFVQQVAVNAHSLLGLKLGDRVIEVGCGNGTFLSGLAAKVFPSGQVVGIDHSDALVAEARAKAASDQHGAVVSVHVGDVYKLPFETDSFDAAHCERVLMHLDDPSAAIREMIRVVRPVGVIVAAEPDWAGFRFDHPDSEAFALVYARANQTRQPDVGMTLYRRFGEAGLVDRKFAPLTMVLTDFARTRMHGLHLEPAVTALIAEGAMPADRLNAVVPALEKSTAVGNYYSVGTMHVVAGTVAR